PKFTKLGPLLGVPPGTSGFTYTGTLNTALGPFGPGVIDLSKCYRSNGSQVPLTNGRYAMVVSTDHEPGNNRSDAPGGLWPAFANHPEGPWEYLQADAVIDATDLETDDGFQLEAA